MSFGMVKVKGTKIIMRKDDSSGFITYTAV
jgi:hypothetical protein